MRALIASGTGRYRDPWHPFGETSPRIASVLIEAGFEADIDDDVDRALTRLENVDLLVVNAGDPWRDTRERLPADAPSRQGFADALERGIGILAFHTALASLRDYPDWAVAIGGMWVPTSSWHPPLDRAQIRGGVLPDGEEVVSFDVEDERYSGLQFLGAHHAVAHHDNEFGAEPTAWVRSHGNSRVAVDTLGHDARSYDSAGHRRLVTQLARWAARRDG